MVSPQIKCKILKLHFKKGNKIPGMKSSFPVDGLDGSDNQTLLLGNASKFVNNKSILCAKSMMINALGRVNSPDDDDGVKTEEASRIKTDKISENTKPSQIISDEISRDNSTILCAKTMMIEALARVNLSDDYKTPLDETNTDSMLKDQRTTSDEVSRDNTINNSDGKIARDIFERKSSVGITTIIKDTKLTSSKEKKTSLNNNYTNESLMNSMSDVATNTIIVRTRTGNTLGKRKSLNDKNNNIRISKFSKISKDNSASSQDHKSFSPVNTKDIFSKKVSDIENNCNDKNNNNNNYHSNHYNTLRTGKGIIARGRIWKKISSEWNYNNNDGDNMIPKKISLFSMTSEDDEREDDDNDVEDVIASMRPLPMWMQEAQNNLT